MAFESTQTSFRIKCTLISVPGPPILKQITKIQERSFTFDWDPPATTNGIIVEYNYKITPLGPKYDIPVECAQDLEPISGSVKESETFYTFQGANPYYEYEVVVNAATKEGPGEWSNPEKATTLSSGNFIKKVNFEECNFIMKKLILKSIKMEKNIVLWRIVLKQIMIKAKKIFTKHIYKQITGSILTNAVTCCLHTRNTICGEN